MLFAQVVIFPTYYEFTPSWQSGLVGGSFSPERSTPADE
jgi:hypothetical protein